ncbi:NAD(P)-dependent oxidoreductase [Amycolatopsis granulosa]|uniref:NAD(P)-dependent oxidoreductase n=1 Tax=Amycolatopsis granulosa TaxID=185684 RepID=UPI00141DB709|nr:NAD(P)-dependent oxidoreductase [Amycolatopsis granulosa]NIH85250.1 3-hydroxyisobutyrate dehydrogenase-like beta-hydroxyacid dehydrogenase [Amycolatopsis granulosa]
MSTVAFLGLGRMGLPMAANLAKAGHQLCVWNRTAAKAADFARENNATAADTPRAAAAGADFVITMLADDAALLDAHRGPDGILAGLRPGAIAIDMSTVSPRTVLALRDEVAAAGAHFVDAPVSGSTAAATAAALTIMAAGDEHIVDRARPILTGMGRLVVYLGESSRGAIMKLAVNSIVHSLNGAVSEALVLAEKSGIPRTQAYQVFLNSAVAAPFVQYRQAAYERPDETPVAFRLALAEKDLRLALEVADHAGAPMPQAETNRRLLREAVDAGYADLDESGLAEYLRGTPPSAG